MGLIQDMFLGTNTVQTRKSAGNPNGDGMPPGLVPDDRRNGTSKVDFGKARGLPVVFAACRIYSASFMQMRLQLIDPDGKTVAPNDPRYPSWLSRPNQRTDLPTWLGHYAISQASNGNAYWKVTKNSKGQVINLQQLDPTKVEVTKQDEFGNNTEYSFNSKVYPDGVIVQVQGLSVPGEKYGMGPIQMAQGVFQAAIAAQKYGQEYLENGGVPELLLTLQGDKTPEQMSKVGEAWSKARQKSRTAILDNGADLKVLGFSPEDLQFISVREFDRTEVAIMYGLAGNLIYSGASGENVTYQNVDDAWINQSRFGLGTIIRGLEAKLTDMVPRGYTVKLNQDALLRPDTAGRYGAYAVATGGRPFMEPNEVRAKEDLEPFTQAQIKRLNDLAPKTTKTADNPDAAAA